MSDRSPPHDDLRFPEWKKAREAGWVIESAVIGRLLYGLLLRIVGGPCVRYGETDDLAREAADGTRHECQVIAAPVTKDDIARAGTDPLALAFIVDRHWGGSCLTYGAEEDVLRS